MGNDDEPPGRLLLLDSDGHASIDIQSLKMPYDAAFTPNGNLIVTIIRERAVWTISPTGDVLGRMPVGGYPCSLQPLVNGNVMVAGWDDDVPGFVREFAPDGTIVWRIEPLRWPWKAERLPNGNTLIADAGTNRSETQRLADEVFAFAGHVTVVDDGGAAVLDGTNIPDVNLAIGSARARLANNFSPNPLNPDQPGNGALPILRYFAAQGVTSAAVVWPAQADARARGQGYLSDLQQAGITSIETFEVAITETNYATVAQRIENAGSQLVLTTLEVTGMARLAQAFSQVGYQPQVPFYGAQAYGQQFLDLAGDAADGATLGITFAPFDDAAAAPFVEWYGRTAPGSKPDFFAAMSWIAMDMLVRALREAGGAPTRDAVLERLRSYSEFTAEGFAAPRNPAGKQMGNCFVVVRAQGGRWVRADPAGGGFVNC